MDFFSILTLIGGLALFLYGMKVMGNGLKKLAGGKLESILSKLTSNRFKGFLLGFFVTAVIQSSSATTVMLVGFVNSGIMALGQTISIIMGANLGTTVTAWLLSLSGVSGESFFVQLFKPTTFTPVLAMIGVIMSMVCKRDIKKSIGDILIGFAVLMFGMETMSGSMSSAEESQFLGQLLIMFSNPVMGILMGTLLTVIIQSSSASIGILQALSLTCAIPYSTAIPIILGQNIGAAITPIISSISGNAESKRVAVACLYIKVISVVVVTVAFYILDSVIGFAFVNMNVNIISIAVIHTLFNAIATVILIPFCKQLQLLAEKTIKIKGNEKSNIFNTLDERFLSVPAFAVEKCRELVCNMAEIARESVLISSELITSDFDENKVTSILEIEDRVDKYEDKLNAYLVKIAGQNISEQISMEVTELLHIIGDVERISDHSVNISEVAREIYDRKILFSDDVKQAIEVLSRAVCDVLKLSTEAFIADNINSAKKVEPLEEVIDNLESKIISKHINKLKESGFTIEHGFILSDILTSYERIADHCSNIAICLIEISNGRFEIHKYLDNMRIDDGSDFDERYKKYKRRYLLP